MDDIRQERPSEGLILNLNKGFRKQNIWQIPQGISGL